jgi:NAD(P)-dependent dehydrogenase (short-subunit alcohol dehydrogenase family)
MPERFEGKVVLVAGGTGGLGRAVSLAFLEEFAHVAVTYRREKEFVALKGTVGARASSLEGHNIDVTDEFATRQLTGRANSILPSIVDTEANRKATPDADYAKWPKPEEIVRVILLLCSDDAKLVNGAAVPVYGNS